MGCGSFILYRIISENAPTKRDVSKSYLLKLHLGKLMKSRNAAMNELCICAKADFQTWVRPMLQDFCTCLEVPTLASLLLVSDHIPTLLSEAGSSECCMAQQKH